MSIFNAARERIAERERVRKATRSPASDAMEQRIRRLEKSVASRIGGPRLVERAREIAKAMAVASEPASEAHSHPTAKSPGARLVEAARVRATELRKGGHRG